MKAFKVWLAGFFWTRYIRTRPGKQIPMWAIRWAIAGTYEQRMSLADWCDRAVKR